MKRALLSIIFSFTLFGLSFGQMVSIDPEVVQFDASGQFSLQLNLNVTNISGEPITQFFWEFTPDESYPAEWVNQICDNNLCYDWERYECPPNKPNTLAVGETKEWYIKLKDRNGNSDISLEGSSFGIIKFYSDPERTIEIGSSSAPTVSVNDIDAASLVIYPNPTSDVFQIKNDANIGSVKIYNLVGRLVMNMNHTEGMTHDIFDLRTGMYLVRLENKNGKVVKALRLSKR